jgi:hypothetical protein
MPEGRGKVSTDLERQAEAFHQELYREYYLAEAGLKEELNIAPIYERYAHLFGDDMVRALLSDTSDKQRRYLAEWITLEYLENSVKGLTEQVSNAMRKASAEWEGQQIPYYDLRPLIANERDMQRRHRLDELQRKITASANEDRSHRLRDLHDGARRLGFDGYSSMCDQLRGLGLETLTQQMRALLAATRDMFLQSLEESMVEIGVPMQVAATCDLLALFRGRQFDALFPKESMIASLSNTLAGLGIDLAGQSGLGVDMEPRPLKTPRAFCVPIRVPEEVKLVTKPLGGPDDYQSLLHETGHAEHFVHVDACQPFAFKRLGDNSVTEGYAFLFEYLLHNERWLRQILHIDDPEDYLKHARFEKLWLLRRYASKLLYEEELHANPQAAEQEYVAILNDNLGVSIGPENYLADTDDAFCCAQYLRAWIFEVQLRRFLEERFSKTWFENQEAGKYLISLWKRGQELRAEELVRQMGYDHLNAQYLTEELLSQSAN